MSEPKEEAEQLAVDELKSRAIVEAGRMMRVMHSAAFEYVAAKLLEREQRMRIQLEPGQAVISWRGEDGLEHGVYGTSLEDAFSKLPKP